MDTVYMLGTMEIQGEGCTLSESTAERKEMGKKEHIATQRDKEGSGDQEGYCTPIPTRVLQDISHFAVKGYFSFV